MSSNLVDKLSRNPVWQETIKLYSGLLDNTERTAFILDLGQQDILLASECKTISVEDEPKLKKELIIEAERKALDLDAQVSAKGILSLVELKMVDTVYNLLIKIKKPTKDHKDAIDKVLRDISPEKVLDIFNVFMQLDKMKQSAFLYWGIESFKAAINENANKYSEASSIMKCNTWESRKGDAILSVYGKTIQTSYYDRTRTDSQNEV